MRPALLYDNCRRRLTGLHTASRTCAFPGDKGWAGREHANVLGAVRNTTDILVRYADSARGAVPDALAEEALKFLVHFIGDLHMPLHLTGRDRGGNGNKVRFDGRVTSECSSLRPRRSAPVSRSAFFLGPLPRNPSVMLTTPPHPDLHSVWDSRLLAKALRTVPRNYTVPLPDSPLIERALRGAIYDPYVRRIAWEYLSADGAWAPDVPRWLACPTPEAPHPGAWGALQRFAGLAPAPAAGADTDDGAVCPYAWSAAIHPLNCEVVWPAALDTPSARHAARAPSARDADTHGCGHAHAETAEQELAAILGEERDAPGGPRRPSPYIELDTPEYAGVIAERLIMERLMAQGGIRLAAVLNWLFVFPDGADRRAMGVPSVA